MKKQLLKKTAATFVSALTLVCSADLAFAHVCLPCTGGTNHTWIWLVILGVAVAALIAIAIVLALNNRKKTQDDSPHDDSGEDE